MQTILKIDPTDNLIVALQDLRKEQRVHWNDEAYVLRSDVTAAALRAEYPQPRSDPDGARSGAPCRAPRHHAGPA